MADDQTFSRRDAVTFLGLLPDEPDMIPLEPPSGFFWITGGCYGGSQDTYGIAQVRVCFSGESLDFAMTKDDAVSLRDLLDQAIASMTECGGDG